MSDKRVKKYKAPKKINIPHRKWPDAEITTSPIWCSVDLRDGNQALPNPLTPDAKLEYFLMLCDIGFKHIEIAFPSASQDDFNFTRRLIEENHIPADVFVMVLTQCRPHLIERTFESIVGIPRGIVHAYIPTSDLHMKQVFGLTRQQTIEMAVRAVEQIRSLADTMPDSDIRFEFSPEEFTDTDLDFCLEISNAVFETWGKASSEKPLIFNLPATVERRPPNHYADMIELFAERFAHRNEILISLHSHNDQGMAVAGTELGLLAGADRVEGTLFGHGERTGNVDLVTIANNLFVRGVDTGLNFSNLEEIAATVKKLTDMPVYYRQPYAGEYAFTAFSGSHQDAIRKGMAKKREESAEIFGVSWKVPYLHIDPADMGRKYENLIRINSQSGKGGIAWVLEHDCGLEVPRPMHHEIRNAVQIVADKTARELNSDEVLSIFTKEFVEPAGPFELLGYWPRPDDKNPTEIHGEVQLKVSGKTQTLTADGNGPVDAFVHCLKQVAAADFRIQDYHEQAIGQGADARAMAYVPLEFDDGQIIFGVGSDTNIDQAAVRAIIAGLNRKASKDSD